MYIDKIVDPTEQVVVKDISIKVLRRLLVEFRRRSQQRNLDGLFY